MIGNGSGMAGLLSHLKQRVAKEHCQNWLIYGERQQAFDAIFADELHELQNQGKIAEIDRVFSRDGFAEKYVQDVLVVKKAELIDWLEQGACLYICGSLNMAKAVDATLQEILGIEQLHTLRKAGHYRRNVY
ncbi:MULTISPECIES: hypothetical protein [unclassified Acinetobacter]|nr:MULTISPECIES: hypothetical protein [unclassified Acinetobacter]